MTAVLLLLSPAALIAAAIVAVAAHARPRFAATAAVLGCAGGAALALVAAAPVLLGAAPLSIVTFRGSPFGPLSFGLDAVSAVFLSIISILSVPAAVYGTGYLDHHPEPRRVGVAHGLFALLVAAMGLVVTARNAAAFIVAWETMTIVAFFLVAFDHERPDVRKAGFRYLVASQLSAAFILAFFGVLCARAGSFDFADLGRAARAAPDAVVWLLFVAAVVGFGTKAGLVPFHVWLPRAHPAAPSHVSALMSGALIKVGVYGIVRALLLLGDPSAAFGMSLVVIGAAGAVVGIANAALQRDVKRSLAYSSVENIGIALVGFGLSQMAAAAGEREIAALAAAGAFLHLVNHMLMKGLLFLGAGAVLHSTGERDMERLGGLMKRMPWTGGAFVVGAAAISSLPPLCGFVGEWLILVAGIKAVGALPVAQSAVVAAAVLALLFAGGLAAASFARIVAVAFLGEPRSAAAQHAHEAGWALRGPLLVLAALCFVPGLAPGAVVSLVAPAVNLVVGGPGDALPRTAQTIQTVGTVGAVASLLVVLVVAAALARRLWAGRRAPESVSTWGCGYAQPNVRMQYTATSFSAPLTRVVSAVTGSPEVVRPATSTFLHHAGRPPARGDLIEVGLYERCFDAVVRRFAVIRGLQDGRLGRYLLQIMAVLVLCLIWAVASQRVLK